MANTFARDLRKNLTDAERCLWARLRGRQLGMSFRRQEPIGHYIVDFVCYRALLIIECDGGQHVESGRDVRRDAWFAREGFRVLRFWNNDVLRNTDAVIAAIWAALRTGHPPPP